MSQNAIIKTITLPDGREIIIETGKLAKQADGSVVVRMGNTMLLAAVVSNKDAREGVDFLPLSVDYQEKFASSGKIPGGFLKREARLSDYEVLVSRLVDRILRPMFPGDYHAETQMTINLISADTEVMPDALAALAASAALAVSDIPFNGPISEVRVARIDGQLVINPNASDLSRADIDMMVGASADSVAMVEGEMSEVSEAEMLEAIQFAHAAIKVQCQAQVELAELVGKTQKRVYSHETHDEELRQKVYAATYDKAYAVAKRGSANKTERKEGFAAVVNEFIESLGEDHGYDLGLIKTYYHDVEKEAVRNMIMDERVRLDGRQLDEIRPIWSEINYLPATHGSAIFTRGETQSLTTITLGTKLDEQLIDSAMVSGTNKFLLHYNFPAYSTGEVKPNRGPGRREIGHGNLALRALKKVLPPESENPYTIRIVSDILESNGSSSMATVCAGSLALMDAGIPIKSAVSGIAMGLITDVASGKFAVLSDILGDEDHLGDMDFKVTGTKDGITACQMDIKVQGLSYEVLSQALEQAKAGRAHILNEMSKTISAPNADYKPHTPRSYNIVIDKEFIGAVIGPGGKVIQQIQKDTGATVIIEEKNEKGHVNIFASNQESMDSAISKIKGIVAQPEVGETYIGKVKSIQPYGAFVEFMPGKDGLLHISEIKHERLETMDGVLEIGEEVKVKLIDVDKKTGKFKLSRKAALPKTDATQQNQ
ncbi:polyribonucleotide nucleotidyltransferase [Pontibacter harenae]|uniref:polyribonucleotide nucleotidyltransferase n=1 Tax=Pontibacter harenae TaxID=2894083 RepID=UPI001E41E46A|nr:polyribonucleotide nucleotidyltransferase [Pontibacter harenae]MCC9167424.1 polyribonucleotide nucleotidyltransferase [Pontibacter harenae]